MVLRLLGDTPSLLRPPPCLSCLSYGRLYGCSHVRKFRVVPAVLVCDPRTVVSVLVPSVNSKCLLLFLLNGDVGSLISFSLSPFLGGGAGEVISSLLLPIDAASGLSLQPVFDSSSSFPELGVIGLSSHRGVDGDTSSIVISSSLLVRGELVRLLVLEMRVSLLGVVDLIPMLSIERLVSVGSKSGVVDSLLLRPAVAIVGVGSAPGVVDLRLLLFDPDGDILVLGSASTSPVASLGRRSSSSRLRFDEVNPIGLPVLSELIVFVFPS